MAEEALRMELDRIASLASKLAGASVAAVCIQVDDELAVQGDATLRDLLAGAPDLLADLLEHHASRGDRVLVHHGGEPRLHLPKVFSLFEEFPSAGSCAVRGEDGGLLGCLLFAAPSPREWDDESLDDLDEVARLLGSALVRAERVKESSWLEEAVQVQAAYLDHLFEAAPEAIAVLDGDNRIVRVNRQYTRLYGFTPEEAIGRSPGELTVPPGSLDQARELGLQAKRGEQVRAEVVRRRKDGTEVHVALHCIPVHISREQVGVYTIMRDLTTEVDARQAVERREERFRALIENATDLVAIVAAGGTIEYVTPSAERLLGHAPAELLGKSAFGLVHPDDAPDVIVRFTSVVRDNCSGSFEFRLRGEGDEWRTFEVRAKNMLDDPELGGVVVNARDVTAERSAKMMQRRLDSFLEATPDFVAILDPHGRALSLNRAFREVLGIEATGAQSLDKLTLEDLFPREVTERLLHEGIPMASRNGAWSGETRLRRKSGEEIPISQVILAHRSPSGKLEFLSTLGRDITAQKTAESALRTSEAHFRSLIENALDVITIVDPQGGIQFVSPSAKRLLGHAPETLVGSNIFNFIHPEDVPAAAASFSNVLQQDWEPGAPAELRVRHADGSWRRLESVSHNLLDDPAVGGIVVNSRDVTERRRAEDALFDSQQQLLQAQKMEAVGRLAGGIAHDFNNLLTAIKGFTELLLLDFEERDPRRGFAAEIQGAATRAAGLTRQLLAFSRRQVLQPEVLDLNTTVSEMEKMLQRLVGEDLQMTCSLASTIGRIKADPGQLEQVLMNLVVNARDAMPTGGELRIRTADATLTEDDTKQQPYVQPGDYVLLEVSDTGSGMSREIQDRVFEPFFTTKEKGKGTGLGLSTVYGIVKQSEGYIWVDSDPGEGTTIRIYLPRVEEDVVERHTEPVDPSRLEGSETILVVEDEVAVRVLVRRVLERMGYHVLDAPDGQAAIELLQTNGIEPDLLLTDVVMPGMSGRELADQLVERLPELEVLYMSGYTDESIVHHGVLDPGVAFIEKPFTPDVLLRKLREVFGAPAR
ncbi:MAG: PAS domain S-box protein [Gemmatimonadota bacterium]